MNTYSHGQLVLRSLELGELGTNCYIVTDNNSLETILVDPADSAETIIEVVNREQLQPISILLTHGHFDHVLGLLELKLALDLPVFMHQEDNPLLKTAQASAQHWLGHSVDPVPNATQNIVEGNTLALGDLTITVLHTPGHTQGSVCLLVQDSDEPLALLTGDTVFKNSVGRTDFSYSKPLLLRDSLEKLLRFEDTLSCYPGHGAPTTIGEIRQFLS